MRDYLRCWPLRRDSFRNLTRPTMTLSDYDLMIQAYLLKPYVEEMMGRAYVWDLRGLRLGA